MTCPNANECAQAIGYEGSDCARWPYRSGWYQGTLSNALYKLKSGASRDHVIDLIEVTLGQDWSARPCPAYEEAKNETAKFQTSDDSSISNGE